MSAGLDAVGDPAPLSHDAIFRIASLTKPIAAAATMLLVDDGVLTLWDPVDELLPELAGRRSCAPWRAHSTTPCRRIGVSPSKSC